MSMLSPFLVDLLLQVGGDDIQTEGTGEGGGQSPWTMLYLMFFIFFIFWFIVFRPESRKRKAREQKIGSLKKGDQIVTTGGICGRVVGVDEEIAIVQVDKNKDVRLRVVKSSIFEVNSGEEPSKDEKSKS